MEKKVATLELQCDDLEQYSRRNSLRIEGIPERKDEDVVGTVMGVLNAMHLEPGVTIDSIDRVQRLGVWKQSNTKPRVMLVKLSTYRVRQHIFSAKKKLKTISLTPRSHEESQGASTPNNAQAKLFINEDLTQYRSKLLNECRVAKKKKYILDCWSFDGRIMIRTKSGKIMTIKSKNDLDLNSVHD